MIRRFDDVVAALDPIGRVILDFIDDQYVHFHTMAKPSERMMVDLSSGLVFAWTNDELYRLHDMNEDSEFVKSHPDDCKRDSQYPWGYKLKLANDATTRLVVTLMSHSARGDEVIKGLRLLGYSCNGLKLTENYLGGWEMYYNGVWYNVASLITGVEQSNG